MKIRLKKVLRYILIYGFLRTLTKIFGRSRKNYFVKPIFFSRRPNIGLIGCGQFQFSTIAFFLSRGFNNRFCFCYDSDESRAVSLAKFYRVPIVYKNQIEMYTNSDAKLVYIASNHSSHSDYAIDFLKKDVNVYCEKPISVDFQKFDLLLKTIRQSSGQFYAGYNRPYSKAILFLNEYLSNKDLRFEKFTLSCFISAHDIPKDHWYRDESEGTRICGNIGHWLDIMIHVLNWRGFVPDNYKVQIAYSSYEEPDENIVICITTVEGDLCSITITARSEPFEGINETINFQCSTVIAKIDDFRRLSIWDKDKLIRKNYRPKDVGHKRSVMQPFMNNNRDLNEVVKSTELMLNITDMVRNREIFRNVKLARSI